MVRATFSENLKVYLQYSAALNGLLDRADTGNCPDKGASLCWVSSERYHRPTPLPPAAPIEFEPEFELSRLFYGLFGPDDLPTGVVGRVSSLPPPP